MGSGDVGYSVYRCVWEGLMDEGMRSVEIGQIKDKVHLEGSGDMQEGALRRGKA